MPPPHSVRGLDRRAVLQHRQQRENRAFFKPGGLEQPTRIADHGARSHDFVEHQTELVARLMD
jgi:hypothetical protein